MVVIKGKFAPRAVAKQEGNMDSTEKMMDDLGLDNLVVVGNGERGKVVAYSNEYEGKPYFHIRSVWQKKGQWMHGKGLAVDPGMAKELLKNLGELSGKL
jgi:hypothetical protein